jgi:GTPase SAR1 family protein
METTYTIEFMRLAEPPLAPIKHPSAFHVAYYCNLGLILLSASADAQIVHSLTSCELSLMIAREELFRETKRRQKPPGWAGIRVAARIIRRKRDSVLPRIKPFSYYHCMGNEPLKLPLGVTLLHTLQGHTDIVGRPAWSPDGRMIASPSKDKAVLLWDTETGSLLHTLHGHRAWVYSVGFHPAGRVLASGSLDKTICLWDARTGELLRTMVGHGDAVFRVAWSPNGELLASCSADNTVKLWNAETGQLLASHQGHYAGINDVVWSPDGLRLATGSYDQWIRVWNVEGGKLDWARHIGQLHGHSAFVSSLAWSGDGGILVSGSDDKTIAIWDATRLRPAASWEVHTKGINAVAFSSDGLLLASKSRDGTVQLLRSDTLDTVAVLDEPSSDWWAAGLCFHPTLPRLATVGSKADRAGNNRDTIIHLWALDLELLLGKAPGASVPAPGVAVPAAAHHTTARIVLVGDSGVGKTGLGWRLAHGAFKEHASTHGQQFWVVGQLGARRADGTECEAVLWDFAGQPDYRLIHALFLDDADLALLLFDPTDPRDPLHGVEYWLSQLGGQPAVGAQGVQDSKCRTILVAARYDRGTPRLTQEELEAFVRQRCLAGYVRTSARTGEGLDDLLARMKTLVAWEEKPATITTATFKRIKDYVLVLKETETDRRVIVSAEELRARLEGTDAAWRFSDEEMLTAVDHLENYGYVKRLRTSKGERHILLAPELLNNLAASFVLEARRNPRGLGALEERRLVGEGEPYVFPELAGLSLAERTILLDAAALLFLEHHVSFRETDPLSGQSFLVFPELINLKRPAVKEKAPEEGVAYTVSGAVENVFASLVVLLGYTSTFVRMEQWQSNARYEVADGSVCGFRQETARAGELDVVLCFSPTTPAAVRMLFQSLFENFLARRNLMVLRYEPVVCGRCHQTLDRAVVRSRLKDRKTFAFCNDCGERLTLRRAEEAIQLTREQKNEVDAQRRAADARTRFEQAIFRVAGYVKEQGTKPPECFISYAWGDPKHERWVEKSLATDLQKAGIGVLLDKWENAKIGASIPRFVDRMHKSDRVVVVGTPLYRQKYENREPMRGLVVAAEGDLIGKRMIGTEESKQSVLPALLEGTEEAAFPPLLHGRVRADFRNEEAYFRTALHLILSLYGIMPNHPAVADLVDSLEGAGRAI